MNKYYFKDWNEDTGYIVEAKDMTDARIQVLSYLMKDPNAEKIWEDIYKNLDVDLIDLNNLSVL